MFWYVKTPFRSLAPVYLDSISTHHGSLFKSLVTMSRVTYYIPRAHTENRVSYNQAKIQEED